jgi:thiol:disulfide interchange protein
MRTTKSIITIFILMVIFSMSAMAQSEKQVIAVVNKADWCPVCQENGERAMKALKGNNEDGAIKFLGNNLTNEQTKAKSKKRLKQYGLYEKMKSYEDTGVVFFFDAESKELIDKISVAKSSRKLAEAVEKATKD